MHKLGVLDRDAVKRAYRKVGFDMADAELMTQFTEDYNAEPDPVEVYDTKELTKTQILRFLSSGDFTADGAQSALMMIGYNQYIAEALVNLQVATDTQDALDDKIAIVQAQFRNQTITYNGAVTRLDSLEIPSLQRDRILTKLEAERLSQIRLPTLAQLTQFLEFKQITPERYRTELLRLGYPDEWAERFMALKGLEFEE